MTIDQTIKEEPCIINKVSIVFETTTGDNASVKLVTDPVPIGDQEIEDTPAILLASSVWEVVEQYLETLENQNSGNVAGSDTLQ